MIVCVVIIALAGIAYYLCANQQEHYGGGIPPALMSFINWFSTTPNAISNLQTMLSGVSIAADGSTNFNNAVNFNGATNVHDFGFNGGIWVNPTVSWKTPVAFNQPVTFNQPSRFNGDAVFKGATNVDDFGMNKGIWVNPTTSWNTPLRINNAVNISGPTNVNDFGFNGGIWMNPAATWKTPVRFDQQVTLSRPIIGAAIPATVYDAGYDLKNFTSETIDTCTTACLTDPDPYVSSGTQYVAFRQSDKHCWCKNNTGGSHNSDWSSRQVYK